MVSGTDSRHGQIDANWPKIGNPDRHGEDENANGATGSEALYQLL